MTAALDAVVNGAIEFRLPNADANALWPPSLDLAELAVREPEKPKIIMDGLPAGYATGVFGHGGVGKSGICLHLAVCIAAGIPFFGVAAERRRVTYLSCEDRASILHWRLSRICSHLGVDLSALSDWLQVIDLVGHDAVLWERDPRTGYTVTPAFTELSERVRQYGTELLMVDGTSDTFGGNENSRTDVKRYVNALVGLVPPDRGAVLLIGHVDKNTARNGGTTQGYSGSTAWHNSVRARWYLYPETTEGDSGGRPAPTGDLLLELQKSNLGRTDRSLRFRWDDNAHLFVGQAVDGSGIDQGQRDQTEQADILRAFAGCASATPRTIIPAATMGQRTAYNVLRARPEIPESLRTGKPAVRRFWRHVEQLRQMRLIEESGYRRANRHLAAQLVITQEGLRQCAD